jgi:outer membrane protein OmpA-like peptidoglycan-associated protein
MSRFSVALILGTLLLAVGGGPALAQPQEADLAAEANPEYRFDFSAFGGGHFFASEHALGRTPDTPAEVSPKHSGLFGAVLGMHFNRWIGIEAELVGVPTRTRGANPNNGLSANLFVLGYRGSFVLNLNDAYQIKPFLLAGYGGLSSFSSNQDVVMSENWSFVHAGAGFKVGFVPRFGLRFDGRIMVPWTALPGIPHGNRVGYTTPDFEVFGGLYVNFSEVERIHIYSKEKVVVSRGDKDADGIPDDVDKCPTEAEDKDGFEDTDGCPDTDNDKDGIADDLDKCPNEPEDKDGFQDEDGCPDKDNDKDTVPDGLDKCPNEPEDLDSFEDSDGCPDADNDKDGVADAVDKCPNQPETVNHYKDEDGCPDDIPAEVKKFTGVIEGINFKTNSAQILPGSYAVLDRALKVLQDFPDVNLEISGHTDSKGRDSYNLRLSQRRADSVKLYFVSRGVTSTRLVSIGFGESRPIGDNSTASGRAMNRRTEFKLIDVGKK